MGLIKKMLLISLTSMSYGVIAQGSGVGINATGSNPDPSAGLDVNFTDKGLLMPRLTEVQRDGIQNPAIGLQVYNTTTNCVQVFMPLSGWRDIVCDCTVPPSSAFTFPDSAAVNSNIIFDANTSGFNYSWSFQNGTPSTSTQQSPTVVWSNLGVFIVNLTVSDSIGCNSTTTDSIKIINCPPPTTLNFTNCGKTGSTGPSQNQCNNAYTGTQLDGNVTITSGIQEWTVPHTGNYLIEVGGSKGGEANGRNAGLGAIISGQIPLNQGQVLKILVGQQGASTSGAAGGGGGSYVVFSNNTPLIIAGGGSGTTSGSNGFNGLTTTSGGSGQNCSGNGGINGNGGGDASSCNNGAGGGGGFYTDGASNSNYGSQRGYGFLNGGSGGTSTSGGAIGGFGGGAGTHTNNTGGAAGGGYSGGGAPYHGNGYSGGGGGSYIDVSATNVSTSDGQYNGSSTYNGTSVTNLNLFNSGQGYVNITLICP